MASIKEFTNRQGRRRWRVHYVESGTTRHPEYRTFEEACRMLFVVEDKRLSGISANTFLTMRDFTVRKAIWFYLGWQWQKVMEKRLTETTFRTIEYQLSTVPDEIGDRHMTDVSRMDIEKSVGKYAWVWLRAAFRWFHRRGIISMNPCPKPHRREKKQVIIPTRKEVQRLFNLAERQQEKMFIFLCSVCGLRTCEVLALRRSDVAEGKIYIRQHLTNTGIKPGTKRSSGRSLVVPEAMWSLLEEHDDRFAYLIHDNRNFKRPVSLQSYRSHRMKPLYERAGVSFSNHALRHFAAATWIANGLDILVVQRLLGHRNVEMTLEYYGHLLREPGEVPCVLEI